MRPVVCLFDKCILRISLHNNVLRPNKTNYTLMCQHGRAVTQRLDAGFPPRRPGFAYRQHVGDVVDKAALGQVVAPANHSTDFSIVIITRGWHNSPLSGWSVEWTLIPPPTMQIKKKMCQHSFLFALVATLHVWTLFLGHLQSYKSISISFWIACLINMNSYCAFSSQVHLLV
jgi:hypothetical protein